MCFIRARWLQRNGQVWHGKKSCDPGQAQALGTRHKSTQCSRATRHHRIWLFSQYSWHSEAELGPTDFIIQPLISAILVRSGGGWYNRILLYRVLWDLAGFRRFVLFVPLTFTSSYLVKMEFFFKDKFKRRPGHCALIGCRSTIATALPAASRCSAWPRSLFTAQDPRIGQLFGGHRAAASVPLRETGRAETLRRGGRVARPRARRRRRRPALPRRGVGASRRRSRRRHARLRPLAPPQGTPKSANSVFYASLFLSLFSCHVYSSKIRNRLDFVFSLIVLYSFFTWL